MSKTTAGGCDFDTLCNSDIKSYACDYLVDLTKVRKKGKGPWTLSRATKALIKHVRKCVKFIQIGQGRNVKHFYIGKTHVQRKLKCKFDHMKRSTWKLANGINGRFRSHCQNPDYDIDGLVVLTVVTRKAIPPNVRNNRKKVNQELYALALESKLIQHFLIKRDDDRILNKTIDTGGKDSNKQDTKGYPLYMAYKLEEESSPDYSCDVSNSVTRESTTTCEGYPQYKADNDMWKNMTTPSVKASDRDRGIYKPRRLNLNFSEEFEKTTPIERPSQSYVRDWINSIRLQKNSSDSHSFCSMDYEGSTPINMSFADDRNITSIATDTDLVREVTDSHHGTQFETSTPTQTCWSTSAGNWLDLAEKNEDNVLTQEVVITEGMHFEQDVP